MKIILKRILKKIIITYMYILRIFPIKNNKIIFSAFSARSYSDNSKYIAEYIINHNLKYDCVFVLRDPQNTSVLNGIRVVKYNSLKYWYELATAKIWIDNTRKQSCVRKRKNQSYIQTWHGPIAMKKIEKDAEKSLSKEYINTAKLDSKNIDYFLTNSEWGVNLIKRAFWFNKSIEKVGSPRCDILFDKKFNRQKILDRLNISGEKYILLYAPTFRKNQNTDVYNIDFKMLKNVLEKRFGGEWIILLRLHPNISNLLVENEFDFVKNVSSYPDISELYTITNVLITDYSSTCFDFCLTNNPVFLYATDIEEYIDDRDMYFDIRKLPFDLSENNEQLKENILSFQNENYEKKLKEFRDEMKILEDGKASERVVMLIEKEVNSSE